MRWGFSHRVCIPDAGGALVSRPPALTAAADLAVAEGRRRGRNTLCAASRGRGAKLSTRGRSCVTRAPAFFVRATAPRARAALGAGMASATDARGQGERPAAALEEVRLPELGGLTLLAPGERVRLEGGEQHPLGERQDVRSDPTSVPAAGGFSQFRERLCGGERAIAHRARQPERLGRRLRLEVWRDQPHERRTRNGRVWSRSPVRFRSGLLPRWRVFRLDFAGFRSGPYYVTPINAHFDCRAVVGSIPTAGS